MKENKVVGMVLALILLITISVGCIGTDRVTDEFDGEYDTNEDTVLTVRCRNGNIKITRYDGDLVDFHADISARNQEKLDQLDIVVTEEGGNIDIKTEFSGTSDEPDVDMKIKVPWVVHIESVSASNGNLDVRLDLSKGDSQVSSSNGNVKVNIKEGIDFNLTASSSNGNVDVYIDPDENVNFNMRTSNGDVDIHDLEVTLTTDEEKSKIGTIGNGGPSLNINTSNGNVDLYKV